MPAILEHKLGILLDEKGAYAGNITSTELRQVVQAAAKAAAKEAVTEALRLDRRQRTPAVPREVTDTEDVAVPPQYHIWEDGTMHMLPENYILSKMGDRENPPHKATVLNAYRRWWLPDNARGVCRLRSVDFSDFADKNQRKRFSDWKKVCTHLDKMACIPPGRHDQSEERMEQNLSRTWKIHMKNVMYLHPSSVKR